MAEGARYPHISAAERYARRVVDGKISACHWVRKACRRHLDDRKSEKDRDYRYRFDRDRAEKVCRFIELLPHTKGKWGNRHEKIKLEPWQCFLTCCIFGWMRRKDDLRRFRKVFLLVPRKNGKSLLAAAWGLYMAVADGEFGAEVYSGATSERQAWEVFRPARLMAARTPALQAHYGLTVNASNLHAAEDGSRFEPLIGKPGDGASPSCSIHDEYHEHDTDAQVDAMLTGMGARDQPLSIIVTTAGSNISGPCYQAQLDAQKMLDGVFANDELFACIYTVDKDDDWTTVAALRKANPNFDIAVSGDFLKARLQEAKNNAGKQGIFKTRHLNIWVQARDAYFNIERWMRSAVPALTLADFAGQPCHIGLDLASKVDIAALEILFRLDNCHCDAAGRLTTKGYKFARFGFAFLPEETILQGENEHYQRWDREGWLTVTDGQIIDFREIKEKILELSSDHQVEMVAYDPTQATMLVRELQAEGVPVVEYRQIVLNFSEPMKELEAQVRSQAVAHNGDPVMDWMMSNVTAKPDKKDNVYPNKERPGNKIDGPVALMMALGVTMAGESSVVEYKSGAMFA